MYDIDICSTGISNAVHSDDAYSYIFKGKYYWRVESLDKNRGIFGFAELISNKWPEVKSDISLVFVVPKESGDGFVTMNEWIAYENGKKSVNGLTAGWPQFADSKVTVAFIYDFKSLSRPTLVASGATNVRDFSIIFMDLLQSRVKNMAHFRGFTTLGALIDVKGVLTYNKSLVFIATDKYCIIDMNDNEDDAYECKPESPASKLFHCPLNISDRPTTTTYRPPTHPLPTIKLDTNPNKVTQTSGSGNEEPGNEPKKTLSSDEKRTASIVAIIVIIIMVIVSVVVLVAAVTVATVTKRPSGTQYYEQPIVTICINIELNISDSLIPTPTDPDLTLCKDMQIDGAFSADDGNDYVFKGEYYWKFDSNIPAVVDEFGQYFLDRWPQLPTPITTGFVVEDSTHGKSTVFVKGNEWFLYSNNKRKTSGQTDKWPEMTPETRIHTAFTYVNTSLELKDTSVYLFYGENDFIKYVIQDIEKPVLKEKGKAMNAARILLFLLDSSDPMRAQATRGMPLLWDRQNRVLKGAIANKNHLMLFDGSKYCRANITEVGPQCSPANTTTILKCPRIARPTTTVATTIPTTHQTNANKHTNEMIVLFDEKFDEKSTNVTQKPKKSGKSQGIVLL
ncbi:unnamed protein product [Medioppia subpectinata]|uniref:Uncharacterized protein n=1 Tax=Medioppia subpectinata TaxID=1979941 RepID=A0A7R9PW96_9ACAR|nr:unnamed protein product [Medioppia subpectinata]CAG2102666.1 unnamed protein product [Medioppia subpectinata]